MLIFPLRFFKRGYFRSSWLMESTHNPNWNTPINPTVFRPIHQYQCVNLFDNGFRESYPVLYKFLYIKKRIPVTNRFHMIFQWFLINGDTFQNERSCPKRFGLYMIIPA
jgi:hypothetical protein